MPGNTLNESAWLYQQSLPVALCYRAADAAKGRYLPSLSAGRR